MAANTVETMLFFSVAIAKSTVAIRLEAFLPIKTVQCGNCGMSGVISGYAKSINISGD